MEATCRTAGSFWAFFSYRVATRRCCLSLARHRSARFRSLYRSRSMARRAFRPRGPGMTASAPVPAI